jgi:uncharacterized protein (TIGR03437 family)
MLPVLLTAGLLYAQIPANPPVYTVEGLVNAASSTPGALAPNTIATIYGKALSFETRGLAASDIRGGVLPTVLPGTGVRVLIGNVPAQIYYVSPTQVNLLVPGNLVAGSVHIQLTREGLAGPRLPLRIENESPQCFRFPNDPYLIATKPDGAVHTAEDPAHPGEILIVYATGLGRLRIDPGYGQIATLASPIVRLADFRLTLDGAAVDPARILYAGVTPGFGGLYQINLRLPESLGDDPELRIGFGEVSSEPGLRLYVRPSPPEAVADPAASPAAPRRAEP